MKRRFLAALSVVLILAVVFFTSWFYVCGREIACMQAVSDQYTCFVDKTNDNLSNPTTYTLTNDQILQLKELVLSSRFLRRLSHSYTYKGLHDTYSLVLELESSQGKQEDFIQIFIVEDLYISLSAPYTHERLTLKILDPQFCDELEAILLGT